MSKRCSYYHCQAPQACACYGWCVGHRAGLATWLCDHFKDTPVAEPVCITPHVEDTGALVEPVCITPHVEDTGALVEPVCITPCNASKLVEFLSGDTGALVEPVCITPHVEDTGALVEQEEEPSHDELEQIKHYLDRELNVLNTVSEDATPPTTPHELIEQLALEHQATMEKVSREMQEMKAKLEYYESQAIIKEQIASKEREIKSLESTTQLEKKAAPTGSQRRAPESLQETTGNPNAQALGRHRTLSVPRVTQRVGLGPVGLKPAEKISKK